MKRFYIYMSVVAALAVLHACGGKTGSPQMKPDSTEVSFGENDSVVYGYAGAECTDSVLDLIQPPGDPQHFSILKARERGHVVGNFRTGDRVAVVLSHDRKRVVRAIDISSLVGRWITGDSIGDPQAHGFNLSEDGYASAISQKIGKLRYRKWNILGGQLVLEKCDAMLAHPVMYYDTLEIVSLEADTLVLRAKGENDAARYVKTTVEIRK